MALTALDPATAPILADLRKGDAGAPSDDIVGGVGTGVLVAAVFAARHSGRLDGGRRERS